MNENRYTEIDFGSNFRVFTFTSSGRHGNLLKIVRFDEIFIRDNTFNLALGTIVENNKIDYLTTTNNGDRNKVLATVATIIYLFMKNHPGKAVYITGSDPKIILLYQRAIDYADDESTETVTIFGEVIDSEGLSEFEPYDKSKSYSGFLIERK